MMNKKILAVAVAAAFTANVSAVSAGINLDDGTTGVITIASESFVDADLNLDGRLEVSNAGFDATVAVGFTTNQGTSNFVRIDLTNSVFNGDLPSITTNGDDVGNPDFTADISVGGGAGDDYVIFEVVDPTENILNIDIFTLVTDSYDVDPGVTATIQYSLYNNGTGAINESEDDVLKTASAVNYVTFGSAIDESLLTTQNNEVSTVQSTFTEFLDAFGTYTASMGTVDISAALLPGTMTPDGFAVVEADVFAGLQDFTFTGDFSFGSWYLSKDFCGTATYPLDSTVDPVIAVDVDMNDTVAVTLCVQVDSTETIVKSASPYTTTLTEDELSGSLGQITYNTTTIFVPYVTTFDSYNQRIYIQNDGSTDASYSITFDVEDGNTATALPGATGDFVKAGHIKAIIVKNIVEFDTRTRGSATIEIEADAADLSATMQSINLDTKATDTVVLSITESELPVILP